MTTIKELQALLREIGKERQELLKAATIEAKLWRTRSCGNTGPANTPILIAGVSSAKTSETNFATSRNISTI